ncbi:hypothetical protein [Desulfuribacillus alkaliarsenatis]|uniref:Uncharacterized protein n=1 Tax=Desulfuribacillus alkaliarsenatis TaxID=766136 RepID=A0A1E5G4K4_9FIRM|nr:hypothetical protein [Desulfuribacillus alkaliarsenatis]OEF97591.1 hypothetical protein BHF68_14745 [Desulfuribacillus alkaliarsenatis]
MKDNMKRFSIFFLYTIFMIVLYYIGQRIILNSNFHFQSTFEFKPVMIARTIVPIVLGLFLALPKFICEWRRVGKWKYDWVKLLAIGIPTLYIALMPVFTFTSVKYFYPVIPILGSVSVALQTMPYSVAGYAFGYILIASLYKTSDENTLVVSNDENIQTNKGTQI